MLIASRRRRPLDIWPGFVDGLAALLMVVIFVLLLFSLGQFLLSDALVGRDEALGSLREQMRGLGDLVRREREEKAALTGTLNARVSALAQAEAARDELRARLSASTLELEDNERALAALQRELDTSQSQLAEQLHRVERQGGELATLQGERTRLRTALVASEQSSRTARQENEQLNIRLEALNEQLARLASALEASESDVRDKALEIENLGERLNAALANKVEELAAYRSEFFGKLREALRDNPAVRVEGDRFVLPSEVLFSSASADLDTGGKREIASLAKTLKTLIAKIPENVDWVLRVDGHTDKRPVRKAFPSNWELSSARATSIVKYLIEQGIPADHLVAAGFAQYHPLDAADTADAYARNRRIEFKLTSR